MKLHIGNLSPSTTESELKELITPFGAASSVEIVKDRDGLSKGFGFAEFADDAQARAVITGLDGKEIGGKTVKIGEARPRKNDKPAAPRS